MSAAPLRIGFVGAGGNTITRHLPGFFALPDVAFRAVANRSIASAKRVATAWNIARFEADFAASVRGESPLSRTDFATGLLSMMFTDAVSRLITW